MKQVTKTSLGFEFPVWWYETVEEAEKEAGKTGVVLLECNNNLTYRGGAHQEAREIIAEVVEEVTKVERETTPVLKDGKPVLKDNAPVEEYVLDEEAYVKQALAKSGKTVADLQAAVTKACLSANDGKGIRVDIRQRERKPPKPPKLSEEILTAAREHLKQEDDATLTKILQKFLPQASFKRSGKADEDAKALGWLMRDWVKAREKAALATFGKK